MRTFVAVEITSQKVLDTISKVQSELEIKAKQVEIKNMHFTLLFLGEISDQVSQKVQDYLNSIEFTPFCVKFVGIGAFPKPQFPRVIWVGTDNIGGKNLVSLACMVEKKLSQLGFRSDKPFNPHVTIFRVKNKIDDISNKLKRFSSIEFGTQEISEIKFKKSVLTSHGPVYSDIQVVRAKK